MTARRSIRGPAFLLLISLLVAGLLAEAAVRTYAAADAGFAALMRQQDPMATLIEPIGEWSHRQKPGAVFRYGNGTRAAANARGYRGPIVPVERSPGVLRIVLLGGSTTHGWGVDDTATIDAHLRRELAARGRPAEVVNLGFDGYDALQDFLRYEADGVPLRPDVVVVHSGINDLSNARVPDLAYPDPRTLLWTGELARLRAEQARGGPLLRHRIKHWSYLYRLASLVRMRGRGRRERAVAHEVVPNAQMPDYFQRSVERTIALAARDSTAILLSTPPSSLREKYAPSDTSYHRYWLVNAETTQRWRDSLDQRLRALAGRDSLPVPIAYVPHALPTQAFIDDCHLTPDGNALVARDLADAVEALLTRWRPPRLAP